MNRLNMLQLLRVSALCFYLLPSLLCENLLCYYSPILENNRKFELIVTECPPDEVCFKAAGHYGNYTALSARGCMTEEGCSRVHSIRIKGTVYTMSYRCCDRWYCNSCVTVKPLYAALTLVAVMACSL
ncbi:protein Bouncer [Melanotaenia boesemani]|uniref:protein Bouncer n=1 Tax=Melanotaenia boesemani TaxID=1250792 RepID=UPI001C056F33|nr:protein Bouncer [Melanotaenia boesemani]